MSKRGYPYPEDEFDVSDGQGIRPGTHRAHEPGWRKVVPYLVTVIVAVALAFGFLWILPKLAPGVPDLTPGGSTPSVSQSGDAASVEPSESASVTPSAEPTAETSEEPSVEPTVIPEPTETEEPVQEIDTSIAVRVVNGSGISGLAASVAGDLEDAGWTSVSAANLESTRPAANVVYYQQEQYRLAAESIAQQIGISDVVEVSELSGPVSVVLVTRP